MDGSGLLSQKCVSGCDSRFLAPVGPDNLLASLRSRGRNQLNQDRLGVLGAHDGRPLRRQARPESQNGAMESQGESKILIFYH